MATSVSLLDHFLVFSCFAGALRPLAALVHLRRATLSLLLGDGSGDVGGDGSGEVGGDGSGEDSMGGSELSTV